MVNPFGANVTTAIAARAMRHTDLADAIGVQPPDLSRWISQKKSPRHALVTALKIAAGLACNLDRLAAGVWPAYDALFAQHLARIVALRARLDPVLHADFDHEFGWFLGDDAARVSDASSSVDLSSSSSSPLSPSAAPSASTRAALPVEDASVYDRPITPLTKLFIEFTQSIHTTDGLIELIAIATTEIQAREASPEERAVSGV